MQFQLSEPSNFIHKNHLIMKTITILKHGLIFCLFTFLFCFCTDVIDPDIAEEELELLAPTNGLNTILATHTFWWSEVESAEEYILQIVTPNFKFAERLVLDTSLTENKFTYGLVPGTYEWRVQAANTSSSTDFETNLLTIDPTLDISGELLQLLRPYENDTTNNATIEFRWVKLYNADEYSVELFHDTEPVKTRTTDKDTVIIPISWGDGQYEWKLKATNTTASTAYFSRLFYLDTEAPGKPTLTTPADNKIFTVKATSFTWNQISNGGSIVKDSLVIYKESPSNPSVAKLLSNTNYSVSLDAGTYKWYVRSIDKAGNLSEKSKLRSFTINPSLDISNESIELLRPNDNDTTNNTELKFKWEKLSAVNEYSFQLLHGKESVMTSTTDQDTLMVSISWGDGDYEWKLKALNAITETANFNRSFYLDTEAPGKAVLQSPIANDTLTTASNTFNWDRVNTGGSSVKDSLVIYKNSPSDPTLAILLSNTNYSISLNPASYKWYVRSTDKAGNLGKKSDERTLVVE
jgi:hypothetical protein